MLFKHKHLLEDLRTTGLAGTGEVLSMKTLGEAGNVRAIWAPDEDLTTGWFDVRMTLRVVPEDRAQAPFEATVLTRIHTMKYQGAHVPVWYDPKDHSRVVVDYEADAQSKMVPLPSHGAYDLLEHRYDQRVGLVWTLIANQLLPIEVLPKPGTGQLTFAGRMGDLAHEPAQAAAAYVRNNAAALLPGLDAGWFARHDVHVFQAYGDLPAEATVEDFANAGAAVATGLVSMLGGHMVRTDVAVTGRLAPTGALLPVGGLKEKAAAAKHTSATRLVAPAGDEPELLQIPERQRQGLEFVFASTFTDVLHAALAKHMTKGFVSPA